MVKKSRVRGSVQQQKSKTSPGRRRFLKTAAVTAGVAASSGLIDGFPLVWSQNIKDVTLVHVGGSYSAIIDIAKKAHRGPRLQGRDADCAARRIAQPPADTAEHDRHRGHRVLLPVLHDQEGHAAADRSGEALQVVGQGGADLHQGRVPGRAQSLDPGHPALQGAVRRRSRRQGLPQGPDQVGDRSADRVQRGHAGDPAGQGSEDRQLGAAARSEVQG